MSKLLNMLMNLNRTPGSGEVIPDILKNVIKSSEQRRARSRYIICGVVGICVVVIGAGVMFYIEGGFPHKQQGNKASSIAAVPREEIASALPARVPAEKEDASGGAAKVNKGKEEQKTKAELPSSHKITAPNAMKSAQKRGLVSNNPRRGGSPVVSSAVEKTTESAPVAAEPASSPEKPLIDQDSRNSWLISARTAEKRKAYGDAVKLYRKALTYDQENYLLMNNITSMLIRLGDYGAALEMTTRTLLLAQDYVPALINRGIARNALGDEPGAEESFARALKINPANRDALYNFGLFNEKAGKLDAAAQAFKRLGSNGDVDGMIGLARVYEKQSRISDAVKIYVEVTAMRDVPADARNSVVMRLRQLGN